MAVPQLKATHVGGPGQKASLPSHLLEWATVPALPSTRKARAARVAVLGAGNGGLALAAWLARRGHSVVLWNRSAGPVAAVRENAGIRLHLPGETGALTPLALATNNL